MAMRHLLLFLILATHLHGAGLGVYNPAQHAVNGFMPTQLPGLQLWLDAQKTQGLTNGAEASALIDFSGASRNFTNETSSKRPIYKLGIPNGRNSINFDGIDDNLHFEGSILYTQQSVYVVFVTSRPAGNGIASDRVFTQRSSITNDVRTENGCVPLILNGANTAKLSFGSYVFDGVNGNFVATNTMSSNTPIVFSYTHNGSNITNYNSGRKSDGYARTLNNTFAAHCIGDAALQNNAYGLGPFSGSIAEIVVFNQWHSSEKRLQVERYLGTKYGIVVQ